jgi:hypothetical protein
LSIETGHRDKYFPGKTVDWGYLQWSKHIVDVAIESSVDMANYQATQLLGDRYMRISPRIGEHQDAIDCALESDNMKRIADEFDLSSIFEWIENNWQQ